jgi:hypothetical protein
MRMGMQMEDTGTTSTNTVSLLYGKRGTLQRLPRLRVVTQRGYSPQYSDIQVTGDVILAHSQTLMA